MKPSLNNLFATPGRAFAILAISVAALLHGNGAQAATQTWTGATSTDFEIAGNWNPALPTSDTTTDIGLFSGAVTANQPTLSASRSIAGLQFTTATGGWTLSSANPSFVLTVGANGISTGTSATFTPAQTSGTNTISANLNIGAAQTWAVGTGGTLVISGSVGGNNALQIGSNGNAGTLTLTGTMGSIATPLGAITQTGTGANTFNVNGGTLAAASYTENGVTSTTTLNLTNGGTINLTGGFSQNNGNSSQSSTSSFASLVSGTFTANSYSQGRTSASVTLLPTTGGTNLGTYVNGATVNIATSLNLGTTSGGNSSVNFRVDSGSVTVGGLATVALNNAGRWSTLDVATTGTFTSGAIQLGGGFAGNDTLIVRNNAVVSTGTITLGVAGSGATQQVLQLFGGTLNVGAGGIVAGGTSTAVVTIGQAASTVAPTLTATANWASPLNMTLTNSTTAGAPIIQAADVSGTSHNITLTGTLGGNVGFIKNGGGTLTLSAANSFSGAATLNAGVLNINGINALGGANYAGLNFNGGTLQYAAGATGNGSLDISNIGGTPKPVTFTGNATFDTNGNTVAFLNPVGNNGAGGLIKTGSGTLELTNANTYTGTTTVSAGKLRVTNTTGSATGSGSVLVSGGINATLAGNGIISGTTSVMNGSRIAPGVNTVDADLSGRGNFGNTATITVGQTGGLTLSGTANLDFDLASTAAGTSDKIATGGALSLDATTAFTFNELTPGTLEMNNPYTLITGASSIAGATQSTLNSLAANTIFIGGNYTPTYSLNGNDLQVTFAAVPEPGTWAMICSGAGMLMMFRRVRRR